MKGGVSRQVDIGNVVLWYEQARYTGNIQSLDQVGRP